MNEHCKWVSLHIFFEGNINVFLRKILSLLVKSLKENKLLDKFFFIRYFEGGQHVRFRAYTADALGLEKYLTNYFNKIDFTETSEISFSSFSFVTYIPEVERYGGENSISICEDFFCTSSELMLARVINSDDFDQAEAMAVSISLNLSFLLTLNITNEQSEDLFNFLMNCWVESSEHYVNHYYDAGKNQGVYELYEKSYESQKATIANLISNIISSDKKNSKNKWLSDYKKAVTEFKDGTNFMTPEKRLGISASLLHMDNNRLGLANMDESFLYYILLRAVKERNIFCA